MKGIYLAAYTAYHCKHDVVYQDINGERDIGGDMMDVDLSPYAYVIATPPCNWYSKANQAREKSFYALKTRNLLPEILAKVVRLGKPFLVENVLNDSLIPHDFDNFAFKFGGHTFWTNVYMPISDLKPIKQNKDHIPSKFRQGGYNVYIIVERFLDTVEKGVYRMLE